MTGSESGERGNSLHILTAMKSLAQKLIEKMRIVCKFRLYDLL